MATNPTPARRLAPPTPTITRITRLLALLALLTAGGQLTSTATAATPTRSDDANRQVRALQLQLTRAGERPGPIDGRYGPLTRAAVTRFQADHGLQSDGIAGPATQNALTTQPAVIYPGAGLTQNSGSPAVRDLQHQLAHQQFSPGPIDGRYGPSTERAVKRFQAAHHLQSDGIIAAHTWTALTTPPRRTQPPTPTPPHPTTTTPTTANPPTPPTPAPAPVPRSTTPAPPNPPHPPALPLTPILITLGLLGLLSASLSYTHTRTQLRQTHTHHQPPHPPPITHQPRLHGLTPNPPPRRPERRPGTPTPEAKR